MVDLGKSALDGLLSLLTGKNWVGSLIILALLGVIFFRNDSADNRAERIKAVAAAQVRCDSIERRYQGELRVQKAREDILRDREANNRQAALDSSNAKYARMEEKFNALLTLRAGEKSELRKVKQLQRSNNEITQKIVEKAKKQQEQ